MTRSGLGRDGDPVWLDVVVPLGQRRVRGQAETGHLLLADLDAGLIFRLDTDLTPLSPVLVLVVWT